MSEKHKISINPNGINIKLTLNKNRGKMKIQIKFSAEDSEAYKQFIEAFKPEQVPEEDFHKLVFMRGVQGINQDASIKLQEYLKEHPEKLEELKKLQEEVNLSTSSN